MKKIILFLAILFASSITCSAQLLSGVVNDPDGYTNIRTKPTTSAPVLFRYDSGDLIFYSPMKNGWSKVYEQDDVSTFLGYMSTSRIKRINISEMSDPPTEARPTYRRGVIVDPVDSYVNIRKGPGTNYAIDGRLDVGEKVLYIPVNSNWVKIYNQYNKEFIGYVARSRIR
ncbi:MAG: SH3 domain-containing protein [Bacteroidaceae bacterium]|nr:SH3 domain-containing protein [Bacteroidaceae bacterium]